MVVRPIRPEEYDALAALTLAAYRALLGPDMDALYAQELADVAGRATQVDVLVAVDGDEQLLGGVTYVPGPGPLAWFHRPDEAGIRMLAVAPDAQRRGVGGGLVGACVARAVAARKTRVHLHTTAPMIVAQRIYERAGFRRNVEGDRVLEGGVRLLAYVLDLGR